MELGEFVRDALVQLVSGVSAAQRDAAASGARIAPQVRISMDSTGLLEEGTNRPLHLVEFDIAITATEEKGKSAKIGVLSAALSIGGEGHAGKHSELVSRVRFRVPIAYPTLGKEVTPVQQLLAV
jgi:hypothetical protein